MKRGIKMTVSFLVLVLLTIIGTFLPSWLFEAEDEKRQNQYQNYEMEPLVIQKTSSVPIEKKFNLLYGDSYYVRGMIVSSSQEEKKRVKERAVQELKALKKAGALPKNLKVQKNGMILEENIRKCFVMDTSEPESAVYIWGVPIWVSSDGEKSAKGRVSLVLDDETGRAFVIQMTSSKDIKWEKRMRGFEKYLSAELPIYKTYFEEHMKELKYYYDMSYLFSTVSESEFGYTVMQMEDIQRVSYDTNEGGSETHTEPAFE